MIKLFHPYVSWRALWYVLKVLFHEKQLAEGPIVKQLEQEFAEKYWLRNVAAVNSGTSALALAYELAGIGEGDEVITPALTCTATNLPLLHRKATIVFADTDDRLQIDLNDARRRITPKTKAVVVVFFGGWWPEGFETFCIEMQQKGIKVIADAAQAVAPQGKPFGKAGIPPLSVADFTCISMQAIKTLTSGDGGFIICKDNDDHEKAKRLRWFGYDREEKQKLGDTDLLEAGYKYQMNDITASIALGNLRSLDYVFERRRKVAQMYSDELSKVCLTYAMPWMTIVMVPDAENLHRLLKTVGIESGQYHYRNDRYTVFGGLRRDLPRNDAIQDKYLLLPYHHRLSTKQVKFVIESVSRFVYDAHNNQN